LEVPHLAAASTAASTAPRDGSAPAASSFLWSWRAPYYYCHYSDRVQHSGFVRCLEEVVDRFLADRGLSVGRMLRERSWIPVVSRARVQLIEPAYMEETVHTVFTVTDILRGVLFDARMDCFVKRGEDVVPVATAKILHGYAIAAGEGAGGLAELDPDVVAALTRSAR
jgi:acyl-CoA thioesterase FadM